MKLECGAARREILLGEAGTAHVEDHLRYCERCRAFDTSERAVAELVRLRAARPPAPRSLRERLFLNFETERKRSAGIGRRRWVRAAAPAAMLALLALVWAWKHTPSGTDEARRWVEALAADHISYAARDDRAEVASSYPAEVSSWLRDRTQLAVSLPVLPGGTLLGARNCRIRERTAALAFYSLKAPTTGAGSPASLFVFRSAGEDWSGMERIGGAKRFCRAHDRGVSLLLWEDRGLTYALVTEIPEPELIELARQL
jgi:anti-sigma factor RsiW